MTEIKEISYKDERLEFFINKRKETQKRYDRLEKAVVPYEPYLSERRQLLSDCGRELSFYNDVIEMFENGVVPKSEVDLYKRLNDELEDELASTYDKLEGTESKVAKDIFGEIDKFTYRYLNDADYAGGDLIYDITELKNKIM